MATLKVTIGAVAQAGGNAAQARRGVAFQGSSLLTLPVLTVSGSAAAVQAHAGGAWSAPAAIYARLRADGGAVRARVGGTVTASTGVLLGDGEEIDVLVESGEGVTGIDG